MAWKENGSLLFVYNHLFPSSMEETALMIQETAFDRVSELSQHKEQVLDNCLWPKGGAETTFFQIFPGMSGFVSLQLTLSN